MHVQSCPLGPLTLERQNKHFGANLQQVRWRLEIERALHLFYSAAWHTMGVNHSSSDVTVTKKRLNCPYIVVGLQKVRGETVTESMGGDALREPGPPDRCVKRLLDMRFMKMIPSKLFCARNRCKRLLRKEPLPDEILRGGGILLFELVVEKYARVPRREIRFMELLHSFKLGRQLRYDCLREWHSPVFLALSMDRKYSGVEIEILHPQLQAFE